MWVKKSLKGPRNCNVSRYTKIHDIREEFTVEFTIGEPTMSKKGQSRSLRAVRWDISKPYNNSHISVYMVLHPMEPESRCTDHHINSPKRSFFLPSFVHLALFLFSRLFFSLTHSKRTRRCFTRLSTNSSFATEFRELIELFLSSVIIQWIVWKNWWKSDSHCPIIPNRSFRSSGIRKT